MKTEQGTIQTKLDMYLNWVFFVKEAVQIDKYHLLVIQLFIYLEYMFL